MFASTTTRISEEACPSHRPAPSTSRSRSWKHSRSVPSPSPGDKRYDAFVAPWNDAIPVRPAAVLAAHDAQDVVEAVRFAARYGIRVTPQATGHGPMAALTTELLVTTKELDEVTIHPEERWARVGAGVTISDGLPDDVSDPFWAARVGWDFQVLPNVHVDLNANYRADAFSELEEVDSDAVTLGAAGLMGIEELYVMGGAQAIAALAYGTETIRPVDKIVGPGSAWVTEAKLQVLDRVGIDMPAGPTEVMCA